jgi:hypothetical protein
MTFASSVSWFGLCLIPLCMVATVCGSFLIYLAFYRKPSLRNNSNIFFLSLVTADLLTAVSVMPIEVAHLSQYPIWPFGRKICRLWNTFFVTFATLSVCTLCAISVERLWALSRPFRYDSSEISLKSFIILAALWMYAFLSGIYSFFIWRKERESSICNDLSASPEYAAPLLVINVVLPYGTCLLAYGKIFRISHEHVKNIMFTTSNPNNNWINGKRKRIVLHLIARKSTFTLGLLVGSFTICCFPFFVFHIIDGALNEKIPNRYCIGNITKWLFFVCSSTNWALYGLLNKDFRLIVLRILKKIKFRKNRVASGEFTLTKVKTVSQKNTAKNL